MNKQELRKHFKAIRLARSADEIAATDRKICEGFIGSVYYSECQDILVYVSGDIEIGTKAIIEHALNESKRVLCPRCEKGTNIMHFYRIKSFDDLEKGSYGLLEPKPACERIDGFVSPLCIVPALSFDSKGYRLGFGKGFYDRFLADFKGVMVGLCCDSCISQTELPHDGYDICVDRILTESGWINALK